MKNIIDRLKSPVVILQIISIVETYLITIQPNLTTEFKATATFLTGLINILGGLNNPTDSDNF